MPKYTCSHCNEVGYSKNISTRTFFPDNQDAGMLSHTTAARIEASNLVNHYDLIIETAFQARNKGDVELMQRRLRNIADNLPYMLCKHDWVADEAPTIW